MKALLLIIAFSAFNTAYAQDYCKQVKKEVSEDKTTFDYASPGEAEDMPPISVKRSYCTNPDFAFDNFYIVFRIPCELESIYRKTADQGEVEKEEKGLTVTFDDNTKLTDDTIQVLHDYTEDRASAIRNVYYTLTEKTIADFSSKKVLKFSLSGNEKIITPDVANAFQHYFTCIKAVK